MQAMPTRTVHRSRLGAVLGSLVVAGGLVAGCGGGGSDEASRPTTGAGIYEAYCLTCHGADGQGGVGPELAGVVAAKYPDIDDQIALVSNGTGRMPSFRGNLSAAEIRKVSEFTRTDLGQ
jgi:mono/diheme cytochrome c family protein